MSKGIDFYVREGQKQGLALMKRRKEMRAKKFDTIAVHGIYSMQEALANQGSLIEPIYTSTAQHFEGSDHLEAALAYMIPAWGYTRIANPSIHYLEQTLNLLESYGLDIETDTVATSSGMSAVFMATNPFLNKEKNSKMNFLASGNCYGGTFMLFSERYGKEQAIDVRWIKNNLNINEWENAIDNNTRFIYTEMPSNPGLAVADLAALAELAHSHNIPLIVDSTLTSPALMRPLGFGADIVIHSVSKIMNASGMSIAGAVIARHNIVSKHLSDDAKANFAHYIKLLPARDFGPSLSPFSAIMILNDLRSLRSRAEQMSKTAMQVATWLESQTNIEAVHYPGLKSNQSHTVAKKYMKLVDSDEHHYGYLLGFRVKGGIEATRKVFDKFKMIWRATDLGRAKTVATIPAISTHQQQGEEGRELASIPANLIRLSLGLEHAQDIIADLEQALDF